MPLAISPIHNMDFGQDGWTLEKKIEVFIARIEGWQLYISQQLREKEIRGRGFAQLQILLSYFEMIAKYRNGYTNRASKAHFTEGVLEVFPLLRKLAPEDCQVLIGLLYSNVRSGVYHIGWVGQHIILTGEISAPFQFDTSVGNLLINPDRLTDTLIRHFGNYQTQLKDPQQIDIRRNFEKRFDFDTRPI